MILQCSGSNLHLRLLMFERIPAHCILGAIDENLALHWWSQRPTLKITCTKYTWTPRFAQMMIGCFTENMMCKTIFTKRKEKFVKYHFFFTFRLMEKYLSMGFCLPLSALSNNITSLMGRSVQNLTFSLPSFSSPHNYVFVSLS